MRGAVKSWHRFCTASRQIDALIGCAEMDGMLLLVKGNGGQGLAAHVPDSTGSPLCKTSLKLADWHIEDRSECGRVICYHCKRLQGKTRAVGQDSSQC